MILPNFLSIATICLEFTLFVESATLHDAKTLQVDLTNGYNKRLRPLQNQDDRIEVSVGLVAVALHEFDEVLEKFSVFALFELRWQVENMVWDPANNSGINDTVLGHG